MAPQIRLHGDRDLSPETLNWRTVVVGEIGRYAKMCPTKMTGYINDQGTLFSNKSKATVKLEVSRGEKTTPEIVAKQKTHPTQVTTWKLSFTQNKCPQPLVLEKLTLV